MTNFLSSLSFEIIAHISNFTHSRTKRELSMVDLRINAVVLDQTKSLAIYPRSLFEYKLSEMVNNILVNIIQKYPHLNELIIGRKYDREYESDKVPYLEELIHLMTHR